MARRYGDSTRKDWYSISVDTLRGWALVLAILVGLGLAYKGYRVWEHRALAQEAGAVLEEARQLLQRLNAQGGAAAVPRSELADAVDSLERGRADYARADYRPALASGKRSRGVLQLLLNSLRPQGEAGQAQFLTVEGDVEYRRGDAGDWEEARSRVTLRPGDSVRTSGNGSAEIMFSDNTLYTVRPNTQFNLPAGGPQQDQAIQMDYGFVDLSTSSRGSNVKTPGAEARVRRDSEAFVGYDRSSRRGLFGALRGGLDLAAKGGLEQKVEELEQVVQVGDLLSEPEALPGRPEPIEPADNLEVELDRVPKLVLRWQPVAGASRYALQVSQNHLFIDNVIDAPNRNKTSATLGVRGEGNFQWRVAAFGRGGARGPWSPTRKFRVASFKGRAEGDPERDAVPPRLDLENVKSYGNIFIVGGKAEPGSRVDVNGEPVKVAADGSFNKTVQLNKEGWDFIEIRASDGSNNATVRRQRVFVDNS